MSRLQVIGALIVIFLVAPSLFCRDVILEFKGAYFLPTSSRFRDCYKGCALYGPELTVQLCHNKHWYGFASVDYFQKKARSLSICDSTKLILVPLAIGAKYFVPIKDWMHLYLGLGFQPVYLKTKSRRVFVTSEDSQWGFGGIGKLGAYIDLTHHFLLDLFVDYSLVRTDNFYGNTVSSSHVTISGAIFGAGLGYRF